VGWRAPKGEEAAALAAEADLEGGMLAAMCGMRGEGEEAGDGIGREEEGEGGGMWWRVSSRKPWMGWWPRCGFLGGLRWLTDMAILRLLLLLLLLLLQLGVVLLLAVLLQGLPCRDPVQVQEAAIRPGVKALEGD